MTCIKCGGTGYFPQFSHVQNGACFRCGGTGVTTNRPAIVNAYAFDHRDEYGQPEWREDHYADTTTHGVIATHRQTGRRFAYQGPAACGTKEECLALISRMEAYFATRPFDPETREHWFETEPAYGSPEYENLHDGGYDRDAETELCHSRLEHY